jgi:hypothetical protein
MSRDVVLEVKALGFPWETPDPFLFCAYYPRRARLDVDLASVSHETQYTRLFRS